MVAKPGVYDKTQCKSRQYSSHVHRDYLSHCLRWAWVSRLLHQDDIVVDAGCGQDVSMAREMSGHMSFRGRRKGDEYTEKRPIYYGVDFNKNLQPPNVKWGTFYEEFDFITQAHELPCYGEADVVVSFEVVEHLGDKANVVPYLNACRETLAPNGRLMVSTPAFDGVHKAKNHLYELTILELNDYLAEAGFEVVERYGTFASWNAIKKAATPEEIALYEELLGFYSHDLLSCMLAPKYPNASRNNAWLCRKIGAE